MPGQLIGHDIGILQGPAPAASQGPGQVSGQQLDQVLTAFPGQEGSTQGPGQDLSASLGQMQGVQHSTGQARGALQGQVTGAAPGQDRVPGTVPSQGQLIGWLQDQARGTSPRGHQGRTPV